MSSDDNSFAQQSGELAKQGLWQNNPAIVQLLGLCPLLAVSNSVVNALGLGIATLLVLVGSNVVVSLIRHQVTDAIRLPVFVMVIAGFTTAAQLLMQAYTYELYQILGLFIPLIVTNCAILGRADAYASKQPVHMALIDGIAMGIGFLWVLVLLGAVRELIGAGTVFANMDLLLGELATNWQLSLPDSYQPALVAQLPPGAFIITGLLIATKNWLDRRLTPAPLEPIERGSKRVRVTGTIN